MTPRKGRIMLPERHNKLFSNIELCLTDLPYPI
jgi:hypothetical protein